jgi:hypothetical protein
MINPSACVIDELDAWHSGRQLELFDALDTPCASVRPLPGSDFDGRARHDKTSLLRRLRQRARTGLPALRTEALHCPSREASEIPIVAGADDPGFAGDAGKAGSPLAAGRERVR